MQFLAGRYLYQLVWISLLSQSIIAIFVPSTILNVCCIHIYVLGYFSSLANISGIGIFLISVKFFAQVMTLASWVTVSTLSSSHNDFRYFSTIEIVTWSSRWAYFMNTSIGLDVFRCLEPGTLISPLISLVAWQFKSHQSKNVASFFPILNTLSPYRSCTACLSSSLMSQYKWYPPQDCTINVGPME